MKTILVPTDFSKCSSDAIKYAIHFAEKTDRTLLFFHSTFLLIPTKSSNSTYLRTVKLERELKLKMLTEFVENIYSSLNIERAINKTKFYVKFGNSVVDNIFELLNEQFIDLIIMGTHGSSAVNNFFTGSNTASVIEQSYCPVLAIPFKYKFAGIKSIAYASSDLDNLKKELKQIITITQKLAASLIVFYVATNNTSTNTYEKFKSKEFRESLVKHFKFENISLQIINGEENILVDSIGSFVKNNKPDMLIMLTHKRGFFNRIFDVSQTKEISYQMTVPLMALKQ